MWYGLKQSFGSLGHPSHILHVPGRVQAEAGLLVLAYRLNGGDLVPLPVGPSAFRLAAAGDFNIELDRRRLRPGANQLHISASDQAGAETSVAIHIDYVPHNNWPLPFDANWCQAAQVQELAEVVDGYWQIEAGALRCAEPGYDRLVAIGDAGWTNYEVSVPVTIHAFDSSPPAMSWPSMGPAFGIQLRWRGHYDWGDIRPARGWHPLGALGRWLLLPGQEEFQLEILSGGPANSPVRHERSRPFAAGDTLQLRFSVSESEDGSTRYRLSSGSEDEAGPLRELEAAAAPGSLRAGSLLLIAHHMDVSFGAVTVRPIET